MKKITLSFLSLLAIACSTDAVETIDEIAAEENPITETTSEDTSNNPPEIRSQQFQVAEHSASGTSIGFISAADNENDNITYTINAEADILINENTGELSIGENLKLDFESQETIHFIVSAFDGKAIRTADITLNILDINEFDALSANQKKIVAHFKYLTLQQDETSPTQEIMRKWNEPIQLFLSGTISESFRASVEKVLTEYNTLFVTGAFNISLAATEEQSNAKLFLGSKAELETVFPVMFDEIKDANPSGYSRSSFGGNFYVVGRIWVSNTNEIVFKHELGHAIGLGHSNVCDAPNPSIMCSSISEANTFLDIDKDVIRFFYSSDMPSGLNAAEIESTLANLVLLED